MRWLPIREHTETITADAEHLLDRFEFTVSVDAVLCVRPTNPVLNYDELDTLLNHLTAEVVDQQMMEIVFDLGLVEWIEAPWTVVVACFIGFARHTRAHCRLVALHGQPQAVVNFFSDQRIVCELLGLQPRHITASQ